MMRSQIINQDVQEILASIKSDVRKLEGKTILISGGAGFLGSYILAVINELNRQVLKKKCKVISVDNYLTGKSTRTDKLNLDKKYFTFKKADISKPLVIKSKIDFIIHAAGIASPRYYQKYPLETIDVTISGTRNLLEVAKAKKVESFLFFSSSEIYGDPDDKHVPTAESYKGNVSCIGPRSCYDESKRLGETLCMVYFDKFKIPAKIVRPFNVYGPGIHKDDYRVIPSFIYSALSGEQLNIYEKGEQTRSYCYISDTIVYLFKTLLSRANGEVYNVGNSNDEISVNELAKRLNKIFSNKLKIKRIKYPSSYPHDEPKRRCPNIAKAKKAFNYSPRIDLNTGLQRTITWCREEMS
jgi:UDP-glucuronate decarboxylase